MTVEQETRLRQNGLSRRDIGAVALGFSLFALLVTVSCLDGTWLGVIFFGPFALWNLGCLVLMSRDRREWLSDAPMNPADR